MSIKIRSRKNKGRKLQNFIRDIFNKIFEGRLEQGDLESRQMGGAGTDIVMSPLAKKLIPFDIECKNQENLNIWQSFKQAEDNTLKDRIPLLIFKRNRTEPYVMLKLVDFLSLIYNDKEIPKLIKEVKSSEKEEIL